MHLPYQERLCSHSFIDNTFLREKVALDESRKCFKLWRITIFVRSFRFGRETQTEQRCVCGGGLLRCHHGGVPAFSDGSPVVGAQQLHVTTTAAAASTPSDSTTAWCAVLRNTKSECECARADGGLELSGRVGIRRRDRRGKCHFPITI